MTLKNTDYTDLLDRRLMLEREENWTHWVDTIPAIPFKPGWRIRPIPTFMGAMVRFLVTDGDASVSVYLDVYSRLCGMGLNRNHWPHWEIYPDRDGETQRIAMEDVNKLVEEIDAALKARALRDANGGRSAA